jgi:phosphatidylinositol alpha-1,6-mannosyltransferase
VRVLGIFNAFDTPNAGGVQESGRIAWEAMSAPASGFDARALLVSLEPGGQGSDDPRVKVARGRFDAGIAALRIGFDADVALFWHLDLLKLAPLLRLPRTCRTIVFLHGIEAWRKQGPIVRRALSKVDVVFTNTSFTHKHALKHIPELAGRPAHLVHLGVGEPMRGEPLPPDSVPAAIMISRLDAAERYKGHEEVIAAWPLIRSRVPGAQLWIVDTGTLVPALEEAVARAGMHDAVRFFGRLDEAEKHALLQRARCLLLPSTSEGFGLVYLEAMRLGRPCLSGMDGSREVINPPEAGYAVTHRKPQEIADAVVRLLTLNDEWHAHSAAARARYEREFTAAHFRERIVSALRAAAR